MSFVTVGGSRLEVRTIPGDAAARAPLVFLHEGLGSVALWREFPDRLARRLSAPAMLYSRAGYGRSVEPGEVPRCWTARFMHEEALGPLPELLDKLRIERPLLVGHSDGASIALIHAALAGRPVAGLVLMAPHVLVEDVTIAGIRRARTAFDGGGLRDRLARYHDDVDGAFDRWADIWLAAEFRAWSIEDLLGLVRVPVLLIQGYDDEYGTSLQLDRIAAGVAGPVQRVELESCGHSPHRDREADVIAAIAAFWSTL